MSLLSKRKKQPFIKLTQLSSLIAADVEITGDVAFSSGMRVDGAVKGNVIGRSGEGNTPALLVLSEKGHIEGSVRCGDAVINGTVTGDLDVEHFLELQSNARVTGTIRYRQLQMDVGSTVQGQLVKAEAWPTADNHLVTFAEVIAMYMLVWSPTPWALIAPEPPYLNAERQQRYAREQVQIDRFLEYVDRAALHGADGRAHVGVSGEEYDRRIRIFTAQLLKQAKADGVRQVQVQQHHIRQVARDRTARISGGGRRDHFHAEQLEILGQRLAHHVVVVDDENRGRDHATVRGGSSTVTAVPFSG